MDSRWSAVKHGVGGLIFVLIIMLGRSITLGAVIGISTQLLQGGGTNNRHCIRDVDPTRPECQISFREDVGWENEFNATCIKPNVFLVSYERPSLRGMSSTRLSLADPREIFSTNQDFLPPYVRFTCTALFPIDFDFQGNGGLEFFRVRKSVSYVNGTDTVGNHTMNVELLMSPEATGRFIFHSVQNPALDTSFFIFSERPPEGPFLIGALQGKRLIGRIEDDGKYLIPCVVSNPNVTVELFKLRLKTWYSTLGTSTNASNGVEYNSELGFRLDPFRAAAAASESAVEFQCRVGEADGGDVVNVTLKLSTSDGVTTVKKLLLKIKVQERNGAICTGPEMYTPFQFYNIFVRNPTESHLVAHCLLKGFRNCGVHRYHERREATSVNGSYSADNSTTNTDGFSIIPALQLHKEGLLVCIGKNESASLEYFTGFDGKIYTEVGLAPPSALLQVQWTAIGQVITSPSPTALVTGVKYEIRCVSVEFLFVKESQLLYMEYRNGTEVLVSELVWWKEGKELYLSSDVVKLECRDRLWNTNELYISSVTVIVSNRSCESNHFRCASGQCIRENWRCDGDRDCLDNSDEMDCHIHVCKPEYFKCLSGQCIGIEKRCNNKADCPDASDESNETCSSVSCSWEEFKCQNGQCVLAHFLCDGDFDCYDKSDESVPNCSKYFPSISSANQNVSFIEGSSGELICDTIPLPTKLQPRIEWLRNNKDVTDATKLWRNIDDSKLSLRFYNVSVADAGEYTCYAKNSLSTSAMTFFVIVSATPDGCETVEVAGHGDPECSEDFPCQDDMSQVDCLKNICEMRPTLIFCHHIEDVGSLSKDVEDVAKNTAISTWAVAFVIFLLLTMVVVAVVVWRYYFFLNARVPSGSVRLGNHDEVFILNRPDVHDL